MRVLRWGAVLVLAVEMVLLATGRLGLGNAAVLLLVFEIVCAATVVSVALWRFVQSRRTGATFAECLGSAVAAVLPQPVSRLLAPETVLIGAVVRWITRRPHGVPAGTQQIGYGRDQVALVITLVVLTAGEVAAVELLVPWAGLRIPLLILGGYGLLILTGFVAINRTRPHVMHHNVLRLRCGQFADITLDAADIASVTTGRNNCGSRIIRTSDWRRESMMARDLQRRLAEFHSRD